MDPLTVLFHDNLVPLIGQVVRVPEYVAGVSVFESRAGLIFFDVCKGKRDRRVFLFKFSNVYIDSKITNFYSVLLLIKEPDYYSLSFFSSLRQTQSDER